MQTIERSIDWFLHSQIYSKEGGYRTYYSKDEESPVYPEITAYAISLCCVLYGRQKRRIFLDRAEKCANYLICESKGGGLPSYVDDFLYTFDTSIFISCMFDLYEVTRKTLYLHEAKKSLRWLYSRKDGNTFAAIDRIPPNKEWRHTSAVHLAKLAIPLIKASIYIKDKEYEKMAIDLLEWAKEFQLADGRFVINKEEETTMVHSHCYASEGFLYAYYYLKDSRYRKIVEKSVNWLSRKQNEDGSFYKWYPSLSIRAHTHESSGVMNLLTKTKMYREKVTDATAQATRLWKLLGINKKGVNKAYHYLENQSENGGLKLTKSRLIFERSSSRIYSWPTFFCLHSHLLPYGKMKYVRELF